MSLPSTEAFRTGNFFRACTAALTKKLMKPSLQPCSLVKLSWNLERIAITGAMLTSLKVVRIALVDCDCSRRSATRARRRVIGTRCSGRSPSGMGAAATCCSAALGAAAGAGAAFGAAAAASTSPLVTRPSLPVPATEPAAMPASAISLAAAGIATPAIEAEAGAAAAAAGAAATAAAGAAAAALPSVSMRAMTWSETTVPPSPTTSSTSTPADGAGTSSTTLSVSISIRISSAATASPGFFFHCSMVASATDSDSCGTLTSMIAILYSSSCQVCEGAPAGGAPLVHLVSTKPLSLAKAPSIRAFCWSWCRCE